MPLSHSLLALLIVLIWGFNFIVVQIGLQEIPPLVFSFLRFFFFLPALLFVKKPNTSFIRLFWYSITMFSLQFAFLFLGMNAGVPAGLASIITQSQAFFTILLAVIFLNEHTHLWQVIGGIIAFSGLILIGMNVQGLVSFAGFVLILLAAISWSIGNFCSKKLGRVDIVSLVVWGSLIAWPPLLLLALIFEGPKTVFDSVLRLSWQSFGAISYISLLATLLGYGGWSYLLHHHPTNRVTPFGLLVPIVAMISSVLILGEPLETWKITSCVLVIGGLAVNLLGARFFAKR